MSDQNLIKLTRGNPATEAFPIEEIIECSESALKRSGDVLLQYHPAAGFLPLREILAEEAGVEVDQIIVSNGSIQLLGFLVEALLSPDDLVLVERPSYDRTITAFRRAGIQVMGVPIDRDGLNIAILEEVLKRYSPRLLYLIPDFQNPTGVTMSLAGRKAVLSLADQHDFMLIEDSPYRRLRYTGVDIPTLHQLNSKRVIQLSSFSKLLSPGIRVGWMVAPKEIVEQVTQIATDTYITPSMLSQGIVYEFIRQGRMPANIERLKSLYAPRLDRMLTELEAKLSKGDWSRPEGGFFVGLTLPEGVSGDRLRHQARQQGLVLSDGNGFFADGDGSRFLRLPFCALNECEIEEAITRLTAAIKSTTNMWR
ncbi:MAG: PLP-dependent aminotransferase family protein [Candidatus Bipolaricaulota bacterium]|nr:PLP-dependent aminotransferase family protein [Candidatus Bipolaricaulota bacterium]